MTTSRNTEPLGRSITYCSVDQKLVETVCEGVKSGRNSAILAPSYGGKTMLLRLINRELKDCPAIHLSFDSDSPVSTFDALKRRFLSCLEAVGDSERDAILGISNIRSLVEHLTSLTPRPLILFVSNFDGLAYNLGHDFLACITDRKLSRMMSVVATGELGFFRLLQNGSARCSFDSVWMLQGFTQQQFLQLVRNYIDNTFASPIEVDDLARGAPRLYELTGGNITLLSSVFWELQLNRMTSDHGLAKKVTLHEIEKLAYQVAERGVVAVRAFSAADQMISSDPECWGDLEKLVSSSAIPIADRLPPGSLEFSGLAVRREGQLRVSSPLAERFIRTRFTPRRFADLYARSGNWREAFARYEAAGVQKSMRPADPADRADIESILPVLWANFHLRSNDLNFVAPGVTDKQRIPHLLETGRPGI